MSSHSLPWEKTKALWTLPEHASKTGIRIHSFCSEPEYLPYADTSTYEQCVLDTRPIPGLRFAGESLETSALWSNALFRQQHQKRAEETQLLYDVQKDGDACHYNLEQLQASAPAEFAYPERSDEDNEAAEVGVHHLLQAHAQDVAALRSSADIVPALASQQLQPILIQKKKKKRKRANNSGKLMEKKERRRRTGEEKEEEEKEERRSATKKKRRPRKKRKKKSESESSRSSSTDEDNDFDPAPALPCLTCNGKWTNNRVH